MMGEDKGGDGTANEIFDYPLPDRALSMGKESGRVERDREPAFPRSCSSGLIRGSVAV
jgi:hypothetical protein